MELRPQIGGDFEQTTDVDEQVTPIADMQPDTPSARSAPTERAPPDAGLTRITVQSLGEYEPPLLPHSPAELQLPADLPRSAAFQLALDLQWAREHRLEHRYGKEVAAVDAQATHQLLAAVVEVLDGRRPLDQLDGYLAPRVYAAVETRCRHPDELHGVRLRSVHVCQPAKGIIEACGTLAQGHRAMAIAVRLEVRKRRWQCTVLRLL